VFESGLEQAIRRHEAEQWLQRNRAALEAYNEHIEKHGTFSDGQRSF
jgi:antitoxin CcdA